MPPNDAPVREYNISWNSGQMKANLLCDRLLKKTQILTFTMSHKVRSERLKGQCHHVAFHVARKREQDPLPLRLTEPVEKIRLILRLVTAATDLVARRAMDNSRVMPARNELRPKTICCVSQPLPLDSLVAPDARIRHYTLGHGVPEWLNNLAAEHVLHIDTVPRYLEICALRFCPCSGGCIAAGTVL
jgi:hypothetical protein